MNLNTGTPTIEGRYVVYVRCRPTPEYCEPIIRTWAGGKWHCDQEVYGWIGPLPVTTVSHLESRAPKNTEYDL